MANWNNQSVQQERSSNQQNTLPSISDLFRNELASPFLPPPPPPSPFSLSERPYAFRANSYPTLRTELMLPRPNGWAASLTGPDLRPITRGQDDFVRNTWRQMPSPSLTVSRSSSVCSASTDLTSSLTIESIETANDQTQLNVANVIRDAHRILEDDLIKAAYEQGWLQPVSQYSQRLEEKMKGRRLEELAEEFLYCDKNRALYGDIVTIPRKQAPEEAQKRKDSQKKHGQQEEARRNRHRECQHDSHKRCPEMAAELGAEHAKETKVTRTQAGKGPGKDEQLYAAIYTQEMGGRLVQALNNRRMEAEDMVRSLLQIVQQHQRDLRQISRLALSSPSSYVGMKRKRDEMEIH